MLNSKKAALLKALNNPDTVGRSIDDLANEVEYTSGSMRNVIGSFRAEGWVDVKLQKGIISSSLLTAAGKAKLAEVEGSNSSSTAAPTAATAPTEESGGATTEAPTEESGGATAEAEESSDSTSALYINVTGDSTVQHLAVRNLKVETVLEAVSASALRNGGMNGVASLNSKPLHSMDLDAVIGNGSTIDFKANKSSKSRPLSGG